MRDWKIQLSEQGIGESVLRYIKAEPTNDGKGVSFVCQYPPQINYSDSSVSYPEVRRIRRLPDALGEAKEHGYNLARFLNPDKEDMVDGKLPPIYTPDFLDLRNAVAASDGHLNLFEGMSDTWVAIGNRLPNSAGLFAAGYKFDTDFYRVLDDLSVKHINFYVDSDAAGLSLAEGITDQFNLRNLSFAVKYHQPYYEGKRIKDGRDLWLATGKDSSKWLEVFNKATKFDIVPKRSRQQWADNERFYTDDFYERVKEEISRSAAQPIKMVGTVWTRQPAPCPVANHEHDVHSPAFYYHIKDNWGYCHKCGCGYSSYAIADAYGINRSDYKNSKTSAKHDPALPVPDSLDDLLDLDADSGLSISGSMLSDLMSSSGLVTAPVDSFAISLKDALNEHELRLQGHKLSSFAPILNPWRALHSFGGMAHVIPRPAMIGLLGVSGGFKSSLLYYVANYYSMRGIHGIIVSPEWTPAQSADRVVQQMGGIRMDEMMLLELWHHEQQLIDSGKLNPEDRETWGNYPGDDIIERSKRVARQIRKRFEGEIMYLKSFGADAKEILIMIMRTYKHMVEIGCPPSYLIYDYVQLGRSPEDRPNWNTSHTVNYTKAVGIKLGLATFMASQVRKEDTTGLKDKDRLLTSVSGLNFRDDEFNLFVTTNPKFNDLPIVPEGYPDKKLRPIQLAVTKNSLGKTAVTEDTAPFVYADLTKGLIIQDIDEIDELSFDMITDDSDSLEDVEAWGLN